MPGFWQALRQHLINNRGGWDVWIRWYDAVLAGTPTPGGEELDIYRVTLDSKEDWKKGPGHVNALIKRKEEEIAGRSNVNDLIAVELMAGEPELGKPQLQEASSPRRDYFLSYSTKDEKFARWMVALIEQQGEVSMRSSRTLVPAATSSVK